MAHRQNRLYYRLLDAFGVSGCAICLLLLEDGRRYLDSVMYERVTDVPTREAWRESFGLCNMHSWELGHVPASSAPDIGFAIVAADLLRKFEGSMSRQASRSRGRLGSLLDTGKRLTRKLKRTYCPACHQVAESEAHHLQQLLECLADDVFRTRYEASTGLCVPHFSLIAARLSGHMNFAELERMQLGHARSLRNSLEEFVERQDHRSRDALTASNANAWKRAMEFLSGKPGVFGNELDALRSRRNTG